MSSAFRCVGSVWLCTWLVACGGDDVGVAGGTGTDTDASSAEVGSMTSPSASSQGPATGPATDSDTSDGEESSSSTGGPALPGPALDIVFPPPGAMAVRAEVTVRGTASHDTEIAGVDVDGVAATSDDGFATWQAVVPLRGGPSVLTVTAVDVDGHEGALDLDLTFRPLLHGATDLVWDGGEAYVIDGGFDAVRTLDVDSGIVGPLSDAGSAADDPLLAPVAAALVGDTGDLLVVDAATVQRVDVSSGARVTLASGTDAPGFSAPVGLAVEMGFNRALVVDAASGNVLAVDLDSGAKTVISTPDDGAFFGAVGAVAHHNWSLYVVSDDASRIVEVDTTTGVRTTLNLGASLGTVGGAAVDGIGDRLFVGGEERLSIVDLGSGDVTRVDFVPFVGFSPPVVTGLAWGFDDQRLVGIDSQGDVFAADEDGAWDKALLSGPHHPTDEQPVDFIASAAVLDDRIVLPTCEFDVPGFVEVDLRSGDRTLLGSWPDYCGKVAACGDRVCYSNGDASQLQLIDPDTGSTSALIDGLVVEPSWSDAMAYDPKRDALMFGDTSTAIERVDMQTGEREPFNSDFAVPCGLTVDPQRDDLLLIDGNVLWRVPLDGGSSESVLTFDPPLQCSYGVHISTAMPDADTLWIPNREAEAFHVVNLAEDSAEVVELGQHVGFMTGYAAAAPGREWILGALDFPVGFIALDPATSEFVVVSR